MKNINENAYLEDAQKGDVNAQYDLGLLYFEKFKDYEKARYWFEKAAKNGHEAAKIKLDILNQNKKKKKSGFKLIITQMVINCILIFFVYITDMNIRGNLYLLLWIIEIISIVFGVIGRKKQYGNIVFLISNLLIIFIISIFGPYNNIWKMIFFIALFIFNILGIIGAVKSIKVIKKHYKNEKLEYIISLAKNGDVDAQLELAHIYYEGKIVIQDFNNAFYWTKEAASNNIGAKLDLALYYSQGIGVKKNITKAISLYEEMAEAGIKESQYNLGVIYENGEEIEHDYQKAKYWYEKSADQGYVYAQYKLGLLYEKQFQVFQKAIYWYEKASEQGDVEAIHSLGLIYVNENSEHYNPEKAVKLFEKAANLKYAPSIYNLGICYECGIGIEADEEKAKILLNQAINEGYEGAVESNHESEGMIVEETDLLSNDNMGSQVNNEESNNANQATITEKKKLDKTQIISFIIMSGLYLLFLILAIIGITTGNGVFYDNKVMNKVSCLWIFAILPTYLLYLGLVSPFRIKKKYSIILSISGIGLMLCLDILLFVFVSKYKIPLSSDYDSGMTQKISNYIIILLSSIFSEIGIVICYCLKLVRFKEEALASKKSNSDEALKNSRGIGEVLKVVIVDILLFIINSAKGFLRIKQNKPNLYPIVVFILFVLLCPLLAEIMVAVAILLIISFFISIISSLGVRNSSYSYNSNKVYEVYTEYGTRTLTYYDYYNGKDRYKDDTGRFWITEDDGTTFYEE
ncbi:MAG: SEL1-like repeat protein [Anaeroplasmataceae bacterium]